MYTTLSSGKRKLMNIVCFSSHVLGIGMALKAFQTIRVSKKHKHKILLYSSSVYKTHIALNVLAEDDTIKPQFEFTTTTKGYRPSLTPIDRDGHGTI